MAGVNKATILGRLGRDPEMSATRADIPRRLPVAIPMTYRSKKCHMPDVQGLGI